MNDPIELPSLEEVEQMAQRRSQAVESLQISDGFVKCQRCGIAVPIVGKLSSPQNGRITVLQNRIKWLEGHYHSHPLGNTDTKSDTLKALRQELAELLEEDAAYDKLRNLPLYSCAATRWNFVCSPCYDILYCRWQRLEQRQRRKEQQRQEQLTLGNILPH
jgi:hypothetical protein